MVLASSFWWLRYADLACAVRVCSALLSLKSCQACQAAAVVARLAYASILPLMEVIDFASAWDSLQQQQTRGKLSSGEAEDLASLRAFMEHILLQRAKELRSGASGPLTERITGRSLSRSLCQAGPSRPPSSVALPCWRRLRTLEA